MQRIRKRPKYYKAYEYDGSMYIGESSGGSISIPGSPVFLRREDGWLWLERNHPEKLSYIPAVLLD